MTPEEILLVVNEVFREVFANPAITVNAKTTANDLAEWDSLNHTTLIAAIEKRFAIRFSLKEIVRFQNVGDLCALVATKLK